MKNLFWLNKRALRINIFIVFLVLSFKSFADDNTFSIRGYGAYLTGSANELVYRDIAGNKLSELIWGIEGVNLLGVGATYQMASRYKFNMDFYTNVNEGKTEMDDYDWMDYSRSDWTHWSNSATDITQVYKLDFNVEYVMKPLDNLSLSFLYGYKMDIFKWEAIGGTYIYSDDDGSNFRAYTGSFADVPTISFNQYFNCIYLGIGSAYQLSNFTIEGKILYSGSVVAKDEDTHHLRDLYFEDFFENGDMVELTINSQYLFNSNMTLLFSYDYTHYLTNKGYTVTTDMTTGVSSTGGYGGAGIENYNSMISLGFKYGF